MRAGRTITRWLAVLMVCVAPSAARAVELTGRIVDADSGEPAPARLYVQSAEGRWHFVRSQAESGSAVVYDKQRSDRSVEKHTTLSAHPFIVDLPPGKYTLTAERGKEYHTTEQEVVIGDEPAEITLKLRRWVNMSELGWYSGDTHVHRSLGELPNVVLAEDLNVALPLTYWVTQSGVPPRGSDRSVQKQPSPEAIRVDDTHVIYPVNTEYEIFTVDGKPHTLGAVFLLNHKEPLTIGAPPVGPIAAEARRQGALLDLDKHSWPWSMMLVPVMEVDLFELTNNHIWRTGFAFRQWTVETAPPFMGIEMDGGGFTERGWIDFGFRTYYLLLNCGFRLRPSAGTACGVHPVPLGFGRVYVHLPDGFSYDGWMQGLDAGRSFVTTGPMLLATFDDQPPGHTFRVPANDSARRTTHVKGVVHSARPIGSVEVIVNGQVARAIKPASEATPRGGFRFAIDVPIETDGSAWIAVRCFEPQPDGRVRFAHTAPVFIDVEGSPLRPSTHETGYLVERMEREIQRHRGVLNDESLAEYEKALEVFRSLATSQAPANEPAGGSK